MSRIIRKPVKKIPDDNKEIIIKDLIEVFQNLGFSVRVEKGNFKGGFCMLREQKIFLMNKNLEQEKKINILIKNLSEIGIEGIFVKPNIREMIEKERAGN